MTVEQASHAWSRFLENRSESAFSELVSDHIHLVYSAALRSLGGDAHLAKDVTQSVFVDLARKRPNLADPGALSGWLYRHTRFTASKVVRGERRRKQREEDYAFMKRTDASEPASHDTASAWECLLPHLDACLGKLNRPDREALLLRFLKQKNLKDVGSALGVSSDTARKRVSRALAKLRTLLGKRGVSVSAGTLATSMGAHAVTLAPAAWVPQITQLSMTAPVVGSGIGYLFTQMQTHLITMKTQYVLSSAMIAIVGIPLVQQQLQWEALKADQATLQQQWMGLETVEDDYASWNRRRLAFEAFEKARLEGKDRWRLESAIATMKAEKVPQHLEHMAELNRAQTKLEAAKQEHETLVSAMKFEANQVKAVSDMKNLGVAARLYATDHDDRFPMDFKSMKYELSDAIYDRALEHYEFMPHERRVSELEPGMILFREIEPRFDGERYHRVYCFCDGSVQKVERETRDYSDYEAKHTATLENFPTQFKGYPAYTEP